MRGFKYHRLQNICLVLNTFFGNVFKPWEDIFFCAKYQIERIQIYIDCKISVSSFGSSVMLSNHGKTSFCGGADEFSEYIFPASRCYGGAHLDSGHRPPWFCLKIFRKTIFLEGHQHHNNEPHKMHNYCNVLFQNVNQNIKCWKLSDKRQVQISMWYFMFTRHKINFYCFSVIWSSK